jgi:hypothetical protein
MPLDLDAANPEHVAGHSVIDADLGVGGRRLVIISGIALPAWRIDSDEVHRAECKLNLRVQADNLEQSTIQVGLASIGNDDTAWIFATDQARLETAPTGDLLLVTHLALMGEPSGLARFSYQVVLTKRIVFSEITGSITWQAINFAPASAIPSAVANNISVMAHFREVTMGGGPFGGEIEHLTPAKPGEIISITVSGPTCRAVYRIPDPPKGRQLKVVVAPVGFHVNPPNSIMAGPDVQGGDIVTLTPADPIRHNVNLNIAEFQGPH